MDNKQIKIVSLVLLVFVIVFSISTMMQVMNSPEVNEGKVLNPVTTGRVTINVKTPPTTQGKVSIEIKNPMIGDEI